MSGALTIKGEDPKDKIEWWAEEIEKDLNVTLYLFRQI
jgi:hypothetical protein